MLYNVPLYKVEVGPRGRLGSRMRRGGPARSWGEQRLSAEARLSAPMAEPFSSDAQQPALRHLRDFPVSPQWVALRNPQMLGPGNYRHPSSTHLASRIDHRGAALRVRLDSPHCSPQLVVQGEVTAPGTKRKRTSRSSALESGPLSTFPRHTTLTLGHGSHRTLGSPWGSPVSPKWTDVPVQLSPNSFSKTSEKCQDSVSL